MEINYLRQPERSRQCGQHCLAMISGKSIEEIIEIVGTKKGTTTKQILAALDKLGFKHSRRLISRRKQPLPEIAICKVRREWSKSGGWHWVVLYKGKIYDSDPDKISKVKSITDIDKYDRLKKKANQKLSSYIEIKFT